MPQGALSQLDIRLGLYKIVRDNLTRKISESCHKKPGPVLGEQVSAMKGLQAGSEPDIKNKREVS